MSDTWAVVVVVGVCTIAFKAMGPVVLGGRELPAAVRGIVALLAPTLLAALVVVSMFAGSGEIVVEAGMVVGMAAAVVALVLRAPIIVVVGVAALGAALVRLL
jgi:branched chain amino acid efflux pump